MEFITNNWSRYFHDRDEGLGTTYERFILHQYFERLYRKYSIQKVLEAPSFGMTGISGINSMWWALHGVEVIIMDSVQERLEAAGKAWSETGLMTNFVLASDGYPSLPFANKSFALSWNFAALGFVDDLRDFLIELVRVTRKVIFICIPNRLSFGYRMQSYGEQGGDWIKKNMESETILANMSDLNWQADEIGYLDTPPWPDIGMKKEDLLRKLGCRVLASSLERRREEPLCILDYYKGLKPDMEKEFLKYSFLENLPNWLKRFWAHHRYFVFVPR